MCDVCPAVYLQLSVLAGGEVVGVEGHVPANLLAPLAHVVDEETLDNALVNQEDVRVQDIDYGWVVNLAPQPMKGLLRGAAPEGDVEDADATLEQGIGQAQLSECLNRLWLKAISPARVRIQSAPDLSKRSYKRRKRGVTFTFQPGSDRPCHR